MRLVVSSFVVILAAAAGFAPAPLPRAERFKDAAPNLNGKWEFVVWKNSGIESPISQRLEINGRKCEFITLDGAARAEYEFILYPGMSPRGFEWKRGNFEHYVGSYRMQGDRLILVFVSDKDMNKRSTDFSGKAAYHFELRRQSR
jgi:hypothetical protein